MILSNAANQRRYDLTCLAADGLVKRLPGHVLFSAVIRVIWSLICIFSLSTSKGQHILSVGVAGLKHDHVIGLMDQYRQGKVLILGIAESDTALVEKYKKKYILPDSLFYRTLDEMLGHIKPDAVLAYNPISEHLSVVEACAPKGVSVMVEKPLAVSQAQCQKMQELVSRYHIHLLTNYETTWYPTNQAAYTLVNDAHAIGLVRKMVVHDGHQGPKEIGCSPDFLRWLTDPEKNGAGALMDFGCYGANLMTWLMGGKAPIAVTAITRHYKPAIYPNVDDDATIVLEYPDATGIIEASWNWPFGIKDWEIFGDQKYLHVLNSQTLIEREGNTITNLPAPRPAYSDNLSYLADVLDGKVQPGNDLSSLSNNLIVVTILEAARQSAREGKRIIL